MKKKDILTIFIATVVIIGSGYLSYKMLFPASKEEQKQQQVKLPQSRVPESIDERTLLNLEKYKDYGDVKLDNIGKPDIFSGN